AGPVVPGRLRSGVSERDRVRERRRTARNLERGRPCQHEGPSFRRGEPIMHIVRREQPEPDVMMLVVVPGEEVAAEAAPVFERTETVREAGPVLEGLELRLGEWVVVRDVRPRVALGDAEVGEQQRD